MGIVNKYIVGKRRKIIFDKKIIASIIMRHVEMQVKYLKNKKYLTKSVCECII